MMGSALLCTKIKDGCSKSLIETETEYHIYLTQFIHRLFAFSAEWLCALKYVIRFFGKSYLDISDL